MSRDKQVSIDIGEWGCGESNWTLALSTTLTAVGGTPGGLWQKTSWVLCIRMSSYFLLFQGPPHSKERVAGGAGASTVQKNEWPQQYRRGSRPRRSAPLLPVQRCCLPPRTLRCDANACTFALDHVRFERISPAPVRHVTRDTPVQRRVLHIGRLAEHFT